MSTTTQEPASEAQLSYLELVMSERMDVIPERDQLPTSKLAVGAMIEQVRSRYEPLPATDGQVEELQQLASQVGITIIAGNDRATVNRQIHNLRRRANSVAWSTAKAEADAALESLFPTAA